MKIEMMEVPDAMLSYGRFRIVGPVVTARLVNGCERQMIGNNVMPIDGDGPCCWSFCVQWGVAVHTPSFSNTLTHTPSGYAMHARGEVQISRLNPAPRSS